MQILTVAPYPRENTLFRIHSVLSAVLWVLIVVATFGLVLVYLLFGGLFYLFGFSWFITHLKGNGARIGPDQFPDLHARIVSACDRLGIRELPECYLIQSDGILNALAAKFLGRHYVVLFSPIVDALEERPDSLDFYIGHELAHIHRKHTSLLRSVFLWPSAFLPLIGAAYRRAQEYTCDRYGLALCPKPEDAERALAVVVGGSRRWMTLNSDTFIGQSAESGGFWMSFNELTSDYPWLSKRMLALRALSSGRELRVPRRSLRAKLLALFVPRFPGIGGGGGLIMLVALVGVMAAIAIPQYEDYVKRARLAQVDAAAGTLLQHLQTEAATLEQANALLSALDRVPAVQALQAVASVDMREGGTVIVTPLGRPGGQDDALAFVPSLDDVSGAVQWQCQTERPEPRRPSWCR